MHCPRTRHRNNVQRLRGEKHDISLKILHQARFEIAQQAVTLAKFRALAIAPRSSYWFIVALLFVFFIDDRKP